MEKTFSIVGWGLCLSNEGYAASLEVRKAYPFLATSEKEKTKGFVRVVDESGEDYLYPSGLFLVLELSAEAQTALQIAA